MINQAYFTKIILCTRFRKVGTLMLSKYNRVIIWQIYSLKLYQSWHSRSWYVILDCIGSMILWHEHLKLYILMKVSKLLFRLYYLFFKVFSIELSLNGFNEVILTYSKIHKNIALLLFFLCHKFSHWVFFDKILTRHSLYVVI